MGNPQQGKTHQEKSFLYNEEADTRAIEAILYMSFLQTILLFNTSQPSLSSRVYALVI
jgi:hypothetical protein